MVVSLAERLRGLSSSGGATAVVVTDGAGEASPGGGWSGGITGLGLQGQTQVGGWRLTWRGVLHGRPALYCGSADIAVT